MFKQLLQLQVLLVQLILAGTTVGQTSGDASSPEKPKAPNVILLMGDDHGWDETGYNGHPYLQTPVLDEMASAGLRLDQFYSAHPTCSPTRGSVLTGRHPNRYGTFTPNYSLRPEEITLAHLLRSGGYSCGHFGKWHVGPVKQSSPTSPGAMGFDQWLSHDNFFELNPVLSRNGGPPVRIEGESSEIIVDEAIEFIEASQQQGKPFLAVIWFGSPHEPYSGLESDLAIYDNLPDELAEESFRLTSNKTGTPVTRNLREVLRERYAEITAMDRAIGQLRDSLQTAGLRENTLLWYCGDNGTPGDGIVTSPFRGKKGDVYEGGILVPGIVEWPAVIKSPRVSKVPSVTSDILPTICGLAEVDIPQRPLDGIDISGAFSGSLVRRPSPIGFWKFDVSEESSKDNYIDPVLQRGTTPLVKLMGGIPTRNFTNFRHPRVEAQDYAGEKVWLDSPYKLVARNKRNQAQEVELYNLQIHPDESDDIAEQEPARVEAMLRAMKQWQTSVLTSLTGADYD